MQREGPVPRGRTLLLISLFVASALAGCFGPGDDGGASPDADAHVNPDEDSTGAPDSGSDEAPDASEDASSRWGAYAFGDPVTSNGESFGTLTGYARHVRTVDHVTWSGPGAEAPYKTYVSEWTEDVSVTAHTQEDVCALRSEYTDDGMEQEEVMVPMDVHRVDHRVTVEQYDRDTAAAGDVVDVTLLFDAADYGEDVSHHGLSGNLFAAVRVDSANFTGAMEAGRNPSTVREMEDGDARYGQCTEGDLVLDWWGFPDFASTYSATTFMPLTREGVDYEGRAPYGWTIEPASFEVSGHTFEGYNATMRMEGDEDYFRIVFAPGLPVPYLMESVRHSDEDLPPDTRRYALTALEFA